MKHLKNNGIFLVVHSLLGVVIYLLYNTDFVQDFFEKVAWDKTPVLIFFIIYIVAYFLCGFFLLRPVENLRGLSVLSVPVLSAILFVITFYGLSFFEEAPDILFVLNVYGISCISLLNVVPFTTIVCYIAIPPVLGYLGMLLRDCIRYQKS